MQTFLKNLVLNEIIDKCLKIYLDEFLQGEAGYLQFYKYKK